MRDHKIEIKIGQVGWSQNRLANRWQWSRTKVRKFLKDLEKEHQIEHQKNNVTTLVTLINYDIHQPEKHQKNTKKKRILLSELNSNNLTDEGYLTGGEHYPRCVFGSEPRKEEL